MWPSENPWPFIIVCLLAAVGLLIAWSQQKRGLLLVLIVVPLLLSIAAWQYDRMVVTDREKVTANIRSIVHEFQRRNIDKTLSYISDSARELKLLVASAYNMVQLGDDARVTDIQVERPRDERIITTFRVNGTLKAAWATEHVSTMWEARWQQEDGDWKMIDIIPCDAVTGKRETIPDEWRRFVNTTYPQSP